MSCPVHDVLSDCEDSNLSSVYINLMIEYNLFCLAIKDKHVFGFQLLAIFMKIYSIIYDKINILKCYMSGRFFAKFGVLCFINSFRLLLININFLKIIILLLHIINSVAVLGVFKLISIHSTLKKEKCDLILRKRIKYSLYRVKPTSSQIIHCLLSFSQR